MTTQFAYRSSKTIGLTDAYPRYAPARGFQQPEGMLRCCAYGPSGALFAWATPSAVEIIETQTGSHKRSLAVGNCLEIGFSPNGTYIVTWERFVRLDDGEGSKNLKVWDVETGEQTCSFTQKSPTGWNLQYTADEALCARVVTNEVQFFDPQNMAGGPVHRLRQEGVTDFALSPGKTRAVAVFVPERKGAPAAVRVFNIPSFAQPVSQKTFFKADRVQLKWNALGTSILCMTSTDVDKTNKSYYGENGLFLLGVAGSFDCRVTLDKEGPIHDVTWSPDAKEFAVIYGFMPAKTTMFDARASTVHALPSAPRNTILFSPDSRLVIVAGFGNLQGEMDVYERAGMKKVTTINASNTSHCEWSPDSRHILTATTSPRLRVDNGIKMYHYRGALVYVEEHKELFYATMRPQPVSDFASSAARAQSPGPEPHASAGNVAAAPVRAPAGAYRPPHARGRPETASTKHYFRDAEDGSSADAAANGHATQAGTVPGMAPSTSTARYVPGVAPPPGLGVPGAATADAGLSKTALKNKKKREAKKAQDEAGAAATTPAQTNGANGTNGTNGAASSAAPVRAVAPPIVSSAPAPAAAPAAAAAAVPAAAAVDVPAGASSEEGKKIRNLTKKLRAIEELRMRQAGGEKLEQTQLQKIATYDAVLRDLRALSTD